MRIVRPLIASALLMSSAVAHDAMNLEFLSKPSGCGGRGGGGGGRKVELPMKVFSNDTPDPSSTRVTNSVNNNGGGGRGGGGGGRKVELPAKDEGGPSFTTGGGGGSGGGKKFFFKYK